MPKNANEEREVVPRESVLCTEELNRRPSRPANHEKQNRALISLIEALSDSPKDILQTLADTILEVLDCGSAGVSLLTTKDGGKRFRWPAIAGAWKSYIGGGTPRDFGPCGDVLDCDAPLLFRRPDRRYTYFQSVAPFAEEALLAPFHVGEKAVGTIWGVTHDAHQFDAEDRRQLVNLARFASAAYQAAQSTTASRELAAIVESSDDAIVSKNLDGTVTSWNQSAERLFGYTSEEAIGRNIMLIIPSDRRDEELDILRRLRREERVDHFETVRVHKDGRLLDISVTISPIKDAKGRVVGASKVARDITDRKEAERVRKEAEVSARLLQVQDAERRRIARELHDGVGQLMVAIGMNVAQVAKEMGNLSTTAARCLGENVGLIAQAATEIRTVSYLLHPPTLDAAGLQSALRWYTEGLTQRSKVKVELELDPGLGRLPEDDELTLFRIAQECLTNVHRHSGSSKVLVRLTKTSRAVELEVKDEGGGMDEATQSRIASGKSTGVGFRGMRERIGLVGGTLRVQSSSKGTSVLATLPLTDGTRAPAKR